jgi:hypothetical protein
LRNSCAKGRKGRAYNLNVFPKPLNKVRRVAGSQSRVHSIFVLQASAPAIRVAAVVFDRENPDVIARIRGQSRMALS